MPASYHIPIAPPASTEFPQPLELIVRPVQIRHLIVSCIYFVSQTRTRERLRSSHLHPSTSPYPYRADRVWGSRKSNYREMDEVYVTTNTVAAATSGNDGHRHGTMKYSPLLSAPHSPAWSKVRQARLSPVDAQQGHRQVYATLGPPASSSSSQLDPPLQPHSEHEDQCQHQQQPMSRYSHSPRNKPAPVPAPAPFSSAAQTQLPTTEKETHSFDVLRSDPGTFSLEHISSSKTLHHCSSTTTSLSLSCTLCSSSASKQAPLPSGIAAGSVPAFRLALSSSPVVAGGVRGRIGKLTSWKGEVHYPIVAFSLLDG